MVRKTLTSLQPSSRRSRSSLKYRCREQSNHPLSSSLSESSSPLRRPRLRQPLLSGLTPHHKGQTAVPHDSANPNSPWKLFLLQKALRGVPTAKRGLMIWRNGLVMPWHDNSCTSTLSMPIKILSCIHPVHITSVHSATKYNLLQTLSTCEHPLFTHLLTF